MAKVKNFENVSTGKDATQRESFGIGHVCQSSLESSMATYIEVEDVQALGQSNSTLR